MKKLRKFISKNFHLTRLRLTKAAILGLVVGILGLLISPFQFALNLEEDTGLGLLFKLRGVREAPSDIVIVSIDKQSSDKLNLHNNPDKWPRSLHAQLTEKLKKEGARVVAFDVHFIEQRKAEDDKLFAVSIKNAQNVILTESLVARELSTSESGEAIAGFHNIVKIVKPIDLFADPAVATAPFTLPRIPFKVNRYWTFQTGAGDSPTVPVVVFQFATLELYDEFIKLLEKINPGLAGKLPADGDTVLNTLDLLQVIRDIGEMFQADPKIELQMLAQLQIAKSQGMDSEIQQSLKALVKMYGGTTSRYINYYGPPRTVTTIPYYQALQIKDGMYDGRPLDLKGKTVFVGLSEILLADRKDSFHTVFSQADGVFLSGVEIMATVYANIRDNISLKPIGLKSNILLLFFWGILLGTICRISSLKIGALISFIFCILYLLSAVIFFKTKHTWCPIVVPLFFQAPLAFIGAAGIDHSRLFRVKESLRKFVPVTVSRMIEKSPSGGILERKRRDLTVLFADIEGYTRLCEKLGGKETGEIIERHFSGFMDAILTNNGDVNETAGDGLMALFLNEEKDTNALEAVRAALAIKEKSIRIFKDCSALYRPLDINIGINSGKALVGAAKFETDSSSRWTYTATGNLTNIAARIGGLATGGSIFLSKATAHRVMNHFPLEYVGQFNLKNVSEKIEIFKL